MLMYEIISLIQDQWENWLLSVYHLQGEPKQQTCLGGYHLDSCAIGPRYRQAATRAEKANYI